MKVNLNKEDLISLVKGEVPYYDIFDNELVDKSGKYIGGFHDKWEWDDYALKKLSEEELYKLYLICKNSWK